MKLLFLAGSTRQHSLNKQLAREACRIASELGAENTFIDLKDFAMPLFDGDLEQKSGLPDTAIQLKQLFAEHQGIFIASPEYNSAYSGVLKNAIDWISRPHYENEPRLSAFAGKVFAISATSPGALGGIRGLVPLRMLLGNLSALVIPEQLALGQGGKAFDDEGTLVNEASRKTLTNIVSRLKSVSEKQQ